MNNIVVLLFNFFMIWLIYGGFSDFVFKVLKLVSNLKVIEKVSVYFSEIVFIVVVLNFKVIIFYRE